MRYTECLGIYMDCPADENESAQEEYLGTLALLHRQFLRSGGTVTPESMHGLTEIERATLEVVGDQEAAVGVLRLASALRGEAGYLGVQAILDGGEGLVSAHLSDFLDRQAEE